MDCKTNCKGLYFKHKMVGGGGGYILVKLSKTDVWLFAKVGVDYQTFSK